MTSDCRQIRLPLAAVERIEIINSTADGVYGVTDSGDAVGGFAMPGAAILLTTIFRRCDRAQPTAIRRGEPNIIYG